MQVPILNGIYVDGEPDLRTSYPRNYMPVPKQQGISNGYLKPAEGLAVFGTGPGVDRGGINWRGRCYRVMGTKLVLVSDAGAISVLGDVGGTGYVRFDYSFDRLAIASGGKLFYWDGSALSQVTDSDLREVVDMMWVDGYFMTTDGEYLIVTELNDPTAVDPLKYGSSEADPDPVKGLIKVGNEPRAVNRYTIESFQNIGGDNFPFQRIEGAQVERGAVGTRAFCQYMGAMAFVGSGRDEAISVYLADAGQSAPIATAEIDKILEGYSEETLGGILVERRVIQRHELLYIHLPDQTLVYDGAASRVLGEPVWFTLTSSIIGHAQYRAQNIVRCYDKWIFGDPQSANLGTFVTDRSTHYDQVIGWDFGTTVLYNEGLGAIVHDMELVALTGGTAFGADPVVWTSYSLDGRQWSQEIPVRAGKFGETEKRVCWFQCGTLRNWRIQRFRGTSDAHMPVVRLNMRVEKLYA